MHFDEIPAIFYETQMIQSYVSSRLGCDPGIDRDKLIFAAENMNRMKRKVLEPQTVPIQTKAWSLEGVLERKPGSNWSNKDYCSVKKKNICTITDPFLDDVHLLGNEHNRVRAM